MTTVAFITRIAVLAADEGREVRRSAEQLAAELALPVVTVVEAATWELLVAVTSDRIELRDPEAPDRAGVAVDFLKINVNPSTASGRANLSRRQPLARAIGRNVRTVLDATAGLGQDAFLLACMGRRVTAVERSPILFRLLQDGLRRARADPIVSAAIDDRLSVVHADAREFMRTGPEKPDAIYLDPMHPPKRKASALAKKPIRLVRGLVGDDPDAAELAETALTCAARRVVVKRPDDAPPLLPSPTTHHTGKLVRYDVYIV